MKFKSNLILVGASLFITLMSYSHLAQACTITRYGSICSDGNGNFCEHYDVDEASGDWVKCFGPSYKGAENMVAPIAPISAESLQADHPPFPDCIFKCGAWVCPPATDSNDEIQDQLMNMCL